jgi:anti-sigma regulatory factor (Ser/Thr protein kinase)
VGTPRREPQEGNGRFRHEAFLYQGTAEFVEGTSRFVREGIAAGEAVMVAVVSPKIGLLRDALGVDAEGVDFIDMQRLGGNPARIIPAWHAFLHAHARAGRSVRGVGEPIWSGIPSQQLAEAQLHEALLNVAFDDGPTWQLQCPYDVTRLEEPVVTCAFETHPCMTQLDGEQDSDRYHAHDLAREAFRAPLPKPPIGTEVLLFGVDGLDEVRRLVRQRAAEAGLGWRRTEELTLAVHELATNSVRHGGGTGALRAWYADRAFVVEVRDEGHIADPLAGRAIPDVRLEGGRGLWLVNQLCDLVQLRSSERGTTARALSWLS